MNTVKIRDIEIGAGAPKIIVLSRLMLLNGVQTGLKVFLILQRLKMY